MTNTEYLEAFDLLPPGSQVLCALSGGRDSVYLLHKLLEWAPERGLQIEAAHYNHHLRGEESDRDEQFVRDLCAKLDIPLTVEGADIRSIAAEQAMGIEEAARMCRYDFLQRTAKGLIATAHHADDLAETMLFQLARGAGTKGLSGIPPKRGNIVRPILMTTREEIGVYLEAHHITYVEDSTNALTDCSRNVIRHQVMPVLQSINSEFVRHAARSAMLLRQDEAYLQRLAEEFLMSHPVEEGISCEALLELDTAVSARVVRSVWPSAAAGHVQEILRLCTQTEYKQLHLPGGVVCMDGGRLWSGEAACAPADVQLMGNAGETAFGQYHVLWKIGYYDREVHNSFNTFCLKYENIVGTIMLSSRRDGDRVKLQGSKHTRRLKQLFYEAELTQSQRAAVPVIRDEQGIAAIIGFGIAQRCVPEHGEKVIIIQWENKERNGGYYEHS